MTANDKLHRFHFWADFAISIGALAGLFAIVYGFEEALEAWFRVDLVFHVVIFVLATGVLIAEKVFHRHKGTIAH